MRLQMGRIDHQIVRFSALRSQFDQDAVEHTQPAPADKAVVDGLVGTVSSRRIPPAKAIPDHEQDAAQHPPIIHPWHPVRQRKERLDPTHLFQRQHQQITQGSTSCHLESLLIIQLNKLMGPDPSHPPSFGNKLESELRPDADTQVFDHSTGLLSPH